MWMKFRLLEERRSRVQKLLLKLMDTLFVKSDNSGVVGILTSVQDCCKQLERLSVLLDFLVDGDLHSVLERRENFDRSRSASRGSVGLHRDPQKLNLSPKSMGGE